MASYSDPDGVAAFSAPADLHSLQLLGEHVDALRRRGVGVDVYQKLEALRLAIVAASDLHLGRAVGRLQLTSKSDYR